MIQWIISPRGGSNPIPATIEKPLVLVASGAFCFWVIYDISVKNLKVVDLWVVTT